MKKLPRFLKAIKAFTLIELMIVIAIIGILAAIGVPQYRDYATRAKVSEGLAMASVAKIGVAEFAQTEDITTITTAAGNQEVGIPAAALITSDYVTSITVIANGVINILYNSTPAGIGQVLTLTLTPAAPAGGAVTWDCTAAPNPASFPIVPPICRN